MKTSKNNISVIKIGGSTLGENDSTFEDIVKLYKKGWNIVLVHGGGREISNWLNKQGVEPEFVDGLRRTDKRTLEVVISVLSGKINSEIVIELQNLNVKAVGISGSSGLISAKQLSKKLGFVGEIVSCNSEILFSLFENGFLPVVSPLALACDKKKQIYNINADTAAGVLAKNLNANNIIFQTDVSGVLDSNRRTIPQMTRLQALDLINSGIVQGGMIPKIRACVDALETVSTGKIIDGTIRGILISAFTNDNIGTRIV